MEINWLAFVFAALIPTLFGFIYYSRPVFGNVWMQAIGLNEEKMKNINPWVLLLVSILMSAMIALFMLLFCNGEGQDIAEFDTFRHGAAHGMFASVLLVLPILVTNALYEQRSKKGLFITAAYWLITLALMGGVLDYFHHWGA